MIRMLISKLIKGAEVFVQLLATQRCVEIKQEITPIEKKIVEYTYEMKLYDDQLVVKNEIYPITNIFDISYRKKQDKYSIGYIYLHTSQGVRTFHIKEDPTTFIDAYLKLKESRPDMQ